MAPAPRQKLTLGASIGCALMISAALVLVLFSRDLAMFFMGGFFDEWARNWLGEDYQLIFLIALLVMASLATILILIRRRKRLANPGSRLPKGEIDDDPSLEDR